MRIDDVQLGTDYRQQYGGRVRAVDITTVERPVNTWHNRGIRTERRVLCMPLDWETGEPHEGQQPIILPARDLAETWDAHVVAITARREREHEVQGAVDALNEALEDMPVDARANYSGRISISLSPAQAHEFAAWINAARAVTPH